MARGVSRPDRGWSWVVAASCFFASLVLAGIFRTSGVLFVAFISDFGVSREEASWPMVLCISILNLTGPFSGVLARKLGGRPVVITGAVVAAIGISACYLTTSLKIITLLFGGVFGIGYGLMNTVLPGILNAYFLDLRATANGIANSGSCIGSMILPLAFESFIREYGLSGCFLLTGGIVLNIAVAASLLRPPPWTQKTGDEKEKTMLLHQVTCPKIVIEDVESGTRKVDGESDNCDGPSDASESSAQDENKNNDEHLASINKGNSKELETSEGQQSSPSAQNKDFITQASKVSDASAKIPHDQTNEKVQESMVNTPTQAQSLLSETETTNMQVNIQNICSEHKKQSEDQQYNSGQGKSHHLDKLQNDSEATIINPKNCPSTGTCPGLFSGLENRSSSTYSDIIHPFKSVLTCPMFYITGFTNVTFYFLYHMYVVVIVDYALDTGVADQDTKYILVAFSVADLFGRLCFGWVTDRKIVSRTKFVMGCMMLIGLVFYLFPVASNYWSLVAVSCGYGLLLGCTMVIFPILLVDFLGIELHSVSYGCMCFMNGFASFGRPFIIGYFRDSIGSYSSMFYVLGTISILASMLWLLERVFQKNKNN